MDEKYVVFKLEDWNGGGVAVPLDDAVVIRTQDAFAAGGLYAYANQILMYMALNPLSEVQLKPVLDYFKSVAQEAEHRLAMGECKLPD